jgi:hypothetical protein
MERESADGTQSISAFLPSERSDTYSIDDLDEQIDQAYLDVEQRLDIFESQGFG